LIGQKIETLLNKNMPSSSHEVEFTAKDLPSGVYLYRIVIDSHGEAGDPSTGSGHKFQQVKKMILLIGQYPNVISTLEWRNLKHADPFYDRFLILSGISYGRLFDVEKAINKLKQIKQNSDKKKIADRFCFYFRELKNISNKSPFLAGALSAVIPGSGYLYSKQYATALTSFLINGLLIWAVRDAILEEQYGIASAATVFGFGWYIGNIEGSVKAAIKQNEYERHKYLNEVLEKEGLTEYINSE
jgi:hypothetical protein